MTSPASPEFIRLKGVRQNNLKGFDLDIPLRQLTVITGLSGSGKSSLAFDTLYAEGQRRYIETFSPYARQFFDRMDKPRVDRIDGIPPAVAIEQRNAVKTSRSTVGTMTEVCDHLKVLWPHIAELHCRSCGHLVRREPPQEIWALASTTAMELLVTFDLPLSAKLSIAESLDLIRRQGYQRLLVHDIVTRLDDLDPATIPADASSLTVVQDRLRTAPENRARFIEACEQAYHFGRGRLSLRQASTPHAVLHRHSRDFHCADCDLDYREPSPSLFSFNHPSGACATCRGFGRVITIDYNLAVPDRTRTLAEGVVKPWLSGHGEESQRDLLNFCAKRRVPVDVPFHQLAKAHQDWVMFGDPGYGSDAAHSWPRAWYGVKGYFRWLESKAYKMHYRVLLARYRAYTLCPDCKGQRLVPDALQFVLPAPTGLPATMLPCFESEGKRGLSLPGFYNLTLREARIVIETVGRNLGNATYDPRVLALEEVRSRLGYLDDIGLGYLTLDRPTRTLSGGETERVNLTSCLGARMVNTLFVLDEPSVGLHPRDTDRLIQLLARLRDAGNTLVVVEHEAAVIRSADHLVDIGPGQGERGGRVVFAGSPQAIQDCAESITGRHLAGRVAPPERRERPKAPDHPHLRLRGVSCHNLRDLDVDIPLKRLVCVTGVSGSGKSTLLRDVLPQMLASLPKPPDDSGPSTSEPGSDGGEGTDLSDDRLAPLTWKGLEGRDQIAGVVLVDQSPLGRTPRSNPALYAGAFDGIREVFARSEAAEQRGLPPGAFSFNSAEGQCPRCRGAGFEKVEMQFLSDVFIRCPECNGRRYRPHVLEVSLTPPTGNQPAWTIADVLEATADDAHAWLCGFEGNRHARQAAAALDWIRQVGLGYLRLGQPLNTLSGGECQRLKLVRHLAEPRTPTPATRGRKTSKEGPERRPHPGSLLFLFDEPTTGLHAEDVRVLVGVLHRLVDAGHSLVVVEHNLDLIRSADWLLDLGPEAGDGGGELVVAGVPETVAACDRSHTGRFLRTTAPRLEATGPGRCTPPAVASTRFQAPAIEIRGAREHNLRDINLTIPQGEFVVVTGVSGSGKSTLAFDLIFSEGQRRFLDCMSAYARQYVEQMARPDVDLIHGLPPTVSIEQRQSRGGGKSTVATVTEIHHFLRLLFARLGILHCPQCACDVRSATPDQVRAHLQAEARRRGDLLLLAPVIRNRKGYHSEVAVWAARHGYAEVRADGKMYSTAKPMRLDRFKEHNVEIATGVLDARKTTRRKDGAPDPRALIDTTLRLGKGTLLALDNHGSVTVHSTERVCPSCQRAFEALDPKQFSYNSSQGWCPSCRGFGELFYLPDAERGARADAIEESWFEWQEGKREPCPECAGSRLNGLARAVRLDLSEATFGSLSGAEPPGIVEFGSCSVTRANAYFRSLRFTGRAAAITRDILPEVRDRLRFLDSVGLGYLQLGRGVPTLSGGEAQRIRLAAQLGSNLSGVLYVLDEPTIGLHPRDNDRLLEALETLKDRGNSLLVVEHDEETMRRADRVIDLGPGAGVNGGHVVAQGTIAELEQNPDSITGRFLSLRQPYPSRGERRPVLPTAKAASRLAEAPTPYRIRNVSKQKTPATAETGRSPATDWLGIRGATLNNLEALDVDLPMNRLVVVTGVSGSGKSTLIKSCLFPAIEAVLAKTRKTSKATPVCRLVGWESISAVHEVDQSPIGRTPRSIPATYIGFFDDIRKLFAQAPEAKLRGYGPGRFSFNSAEGRCPFCEGSGTLKLEMNFLPPAFVRCESCQGLRFNRETLDIAWNGLNIAQVLALSVAEALDQFSAIPTVRRPLEALRDTGLDYIHLGQTSPTLSGGEAQRIKLVTHLLSGLKPGGRRGPIPIQRRLFILEEPTIGLHMSDVRRLVEVLQRLVDAGHSVVVIEHNLELIAEADWIIDLGPEGGKAGGRVVAQGTPEAVASVAASHTGRFLAEFLGRHTPRRERTQRGSRRP